MVAVHLADIDALGVAAAELEDAVVDEPVVEHDVGALDEAQRLEGEEVRVARTGTDEIDLAEHRRIGRLAGGLDECGDFGLGLVVGAGEHEIGDRAFQHPLPEAAPVGAALQRRRDAVAMAADEPGEPAIGRRNDAFEPRLDDAGENRRGAAR